MIEKNLADILPADIEALITNAVSEGTTLEFKRELPGGSDEAKREFLADVSALANTSGGDILYGIDEDAGSAASITGIGITDIDSELLRLGNILNSGLEPRIRYSPLVIQCAAGSVLLLRIEKSWNAPHRVIFRGNDRFFGRTAAGKYPLDVQQLRRAFTENSTVTERLRNFRAERLANVVANVTPVAMDAGPKFVLHLLPFDAFFSDPRFDVDQQLPINHFRPLTAGGWGHRLTLEGKLVSAAQRDSMPTASYMHLYRNGIVEIVDGALLSGKLSNDSKQRRIPAGYFEQYVLEGVANAIIVLKQIGATGPIGIGVSLTNTKGMLLGIDEWRYQMQQSPVLNEHLFLPEAVLNELDAPAPPVMKPVIDLVWNACGMPSSLYLDADGKRRPSS
jgi:hypothetical protein